MKPLAEVFLKTEGENEEREVWKTGDTRSTPGKESWSRQRTQTKEKDQEMCAYVYISKVSPGPAWEEI